jgi:tape measure domain-containing protein
MSFVAGRVTVPVVPDLRGFQREVGKSATGTGQQWTQNFQKATESRMEKVGSLANRGLRKGLKITAIGATVTAGLAIKGGVTRLMGIEDARASLAGLGNDAKSIDKIMGNALKSVKGTAFGMADAGKVAASAVAAGVKPGKDLERTLKLVGDGATIAKTSFGEMGAIFGKVAASNKIQGDVIAQLNDQGIPIVQLLSKELGKSTDETLKLASQGKVNFETFQNAMENGLGGAALKSGDTMRGSFANMNASLGRVGANLVSGVFPKITGGFQSITDGLGPVEDKAKVVGEKLGTFAQTAIDKLGTVKDSLGGFTLDTDKFDGEAFGTKLAAGIGNGLGKLGGLAKTLTKRIGEVAAKVDWVGLGVELGKVAIPLVTGLVLGVMNVDLGKLLGGLGDHWVEVVVGLLTIAFAPSKLLAPIARIVGKIPFLGPMLVSLAKGFRGLAKPVFGFIGNLFVNMWKGFKFQLGWLGPTLASRVGTALRGIFPALKEWGTGLVGRVGDSFRFAFFQGGRAIGRGVSAAARLMRESVAVLLRPYVGAGTWLVSAGKNMMLGLLRGIRNPIATVKKTVGSLKGAFVTVVAGIAGVWTGLREKMATPVNWIIRNVINKLIAGMNKIPGVNIGKVGEIGKAGSETGSDRAMAARGGTGGKGGRGGRSWGGKGSGKKTGRRTWPA